MAGLLVKKKKKLDRIKEANLNFLRKLLVSSEIFAAHFSANPFLVLSPVPTAVPPKANMYNLGSVSLTLSIPNSICVT